MKEEVMLVNVESVERAGTTGTIFIGFTGKSGERFFKAFVPSDRLIKRYQKELPGSQVAALKVNGKLRCLVQVESVNKKGRLENFAKVGVGHCSLSEIAILQNNLPIAP